MLGWLLMALFPFAFGGTTEQSDDDGLDDAVPETEEDNDPSLSAVDALTSQTYDPFLADEDQIYIGHEGTNVFDGAATNDEIHARGGNDQIAGGTGSDWIDGQTGDDLLSGDAGDDVIVGNAGDDTLHGGDGDDLLGRYTTPTDDPNEFTFDGSGITRGGTPIDGRIESGNDVLYGESGDDTLFGGTGADLLDGGTGDDLLVGEWGQDSLIGGEGNDRLSGGAMDDRLDGGDGDDVLVGNAGNDTLLGGDGDDLLGAYDAPNGGQGGIPAGNAYNRVHEPGDDVLDGGAGDDVIYGGGGNDQLLGGDGNDVLLAPETSTLAGQDGDDVLVGGGDSVLDGGAGDDWLSLDGADGSAVLHGGDGNDVVSGQNVYSGIYGTTSVGTDTSQTTLNGDAGDDRLILGINDTATGGEGNDTFVFSPNDVYQLSNPDQSSEVKPAVVTDFTPGEDMLGIFLYVEPSGYTDDPFVEIENLADGSGSALSIDGTVVGIIQGATDLSLDDVVIETTDAGPAAFESGGGGTLAGRFYFPKG